MRWTALVSSRAIPVLQSFLTYGSFVAPRFRRGESQSWGGRNVLVAKDIMNPMVITIGPHETVGAAIHLLLERRISGMPVVNERGDLVGVITEFALLAAAYDGKVRNDPVSRHMTKQVLSVDENASVQSIADMFIIHRVRRVPVLRQNRIVGQISRRDLLRAVEAESLVAAQAVVAAADRRGSHEG